jgi:predicted SprT family Zn-dependent metalloprotease
MGQSLLEAKVILFNQNYYLSYDEKAFKRLYTHELAHHYNHEKFGVLSTENGHNGSWATIEYDLNKKVFGKDDAKLLLAESLYRYGTKKVEYRYATPDISEY